MQGRVALVVFEATVLFRLGNLEQLTQPRGMAPSGRIVQGRPASGVSAEDARVLFQQQLHTFLMSCHNLAHDNENTKQTAVGWG